MTFSLFHYFFHGAQQIAIMSSLQRKIEEDLFDLRKRVNRLFGGGVMAKFSCGACWQDHSDVFPARRCEEWKRRGSEEFCFAMKAQYEKWNEAVKKYEEFEEKDALIQRKETEITQLKGENSRLKATIIRRLTSLLTSLDISITGAINELLSGSVILDDNAGSNARERFNKVASSIERSSMNLETRNSPSSHLQLAEAIHDPWLPPHDDFTEAASSFWPSSASSAVSDSETAICYSPSEFLEARVICNPGLFDRVQHLIHFRGGAVCGGNPNELVVQAAILRVNIEFDLGDDGVTFVRKKIALMRFFFSNYARESLYTFLEIFKHISPSMLPLYSPFLSIEGYFTSMEHFFKVMERVTFADLSGICLNALSECRQGREESIEPYYSTFRDLLSQCDKREDEHIHQFISGIYWHSVRRMVSKRRYDHGEMTLRNVANYAVSVEFEMRICSTSTRSQSKAPGAAANVKEN